MAKSIVIVESPAKAKTIGKYLGKEFVVKACAGHIKDLPQRALGVNIRRDFEPTYRIIPGKEKIVAELKKAVHTADSIYLAADPDREGEAICSHLAEELDGRRERAVHRILFNEITRKAIEEAFRHPSQIDRNKVEAQQARRILDRLVGYKVSPLLWEKVRKGLSAGRVQTVALRLIVDREKEIRAFVSEEYWNFTARLQARRPPPFEAKAVRYLGKKFKISNQTEADALLEQLHQADFIVSEVHKKERKRNPVPPFITSKLQQDASRQLRFTVKKTMSLAQRLYEGVELGSEGSVGLITYMRTDSTRVADSALQEARQFVTSHFGKEFLPAKATVYRSRKGAQDAHEAIRPTAVPRTPAQVRPYLSPDEFRLYDLIWKRFVASQMKPALFDQTEIEIDAGPAEFKAVGSIMKFEGFLKVYEEGREEDSSAEGDEGRILPPVEKGEKLQVDEILPEQKFTQPPPRYNEASLVKALEERGIGRPSTYQQILSVIMSREYVGKDAGRFIPTELGEVVAELLVRHFPGIFDYDYTAKLELDLDQIEDGKENWIEALKEFYGGFRSELEQARREMKNLKKEETPTGEKCEKCGHPMVIKWGRFGRFLACSNYPECRNTKPVALEGGEARVQESKPLDEKCPQCKSPLVRRRGRYGEFIACSNYPECRYVKAETTGVRCPECGKGELVQRKSRRGKAFYGCNRYPDCRFVLWNKPIPEACPSCGASYLVERRTRREGLLKFCQNPGCEYRSAVEEVEAGVS